MIRLALASVRSRRGVLVGSLVALSLGVVLMTAALTLVRSAGQVPPGPSTYGGADAVIQADRTLTVTVPGLGNGPRIDLPDHRRIQAGLVRQLRAVAGVQEVIGDLSTPVGVLSAHGQPVEAQIAAHPWPAAKLTPYQLVGGRAPLGRDDAVLTRDLAGSAGLGLGDQVEVIASDGTHRLTVVGIAAPPRSLEPAATARIFVIPSTAASWAGTDAYDAIGVIATPGTESQGLTTDIARAIDDPSLEVLSRSDLRGAGVDGAVHSQLSGVQGLFTMMAIIAGFAAIFVVASTFAFAIAQRRREIGLQRAVGATPAQIRWMIAGESLAIAIASALVGVPLGLLLAAGFARLLVAAGLAPASFHATIALTPVLIATGVAVVTSQIAVLGAARRASRVPPSAALVEAATPQRSIGPARAVVGIVLVALSAALWLVAPRAGAQVGTVVAVFGALVMMAAFGLLGPWIVRPLAWVIAAPLRRLCGVSGWLASENNHAQASRVTSIAMPVMITLALGTSLLFTTASLEATSRAEQRARVAADYVISPAGAPGLPRVVASQASEVAGVTAATGVAPASVIVAYDAGRSVRTVVASGVGIEPGAIAAMLNLQMVAGRSVLGQDGVLVASADADQFRWRVGDTVTIWMGDGTQVSLHVSGIFRSLNGPGELILPKALVRAHTTNAFDSAVYVRVAPDANAGQVQTALWGLRRTYSNLVVSAQGQATAASGAWWNRSQAGLLVLLAMTLTYTAIAIANTLVMATADRAKELRLWRLIGASRRQVLGTLLMEATAAVFVGLVLGTLAMGVSLAILAQALGDAVAQLHVVVPPLQYAAIAGACMAIGLGAALMAARSAVWSSRPTE